MKLSDVSEADCSALADLLQGIRHCRVPQEFRLGDMAKVVDSLRWLQNLAQDMAKTRAEEMHRANVPLAEEKKEGFVVKEYHPGAVAQPAAPTPIKRPKK